MVAFIGKLKLLHFLNKNAQAHCCLCGYKREKSWSFFFYFRLSSVDFSGRLPVGLIIIHTYLIRLQNSGFSYVTIYNFVLSALKWHFKILEG